MPIEGDDNWLSDFKQTAPDPNFRQSGATLEGTSRQEARQQAREARQTARDQNN